MLIIAVFCYSLFMRGRGSVVTARSDGGLLKSLAEYKWVLFWLVVVIAAMLGGLSLHRRGREILRKARSYIRVHGAKVIEKISKAIIIYCSKPLTILAVLAITIFIQLLVITAFWFLGLNLKITTSARYYFVFFPLIWVLGALPVSIGGIGIHEGGLVELFTRFAGVAPEAVLALALCQRAIFILASLPGVVIHLFGAHLPEEPKTQ
jgi:uncharacterized membrane protein YbhN (UPF0104 family)